MRTSAAHLLAAARVLVAFTVMTVKLIAVFALLAVSVAAARLHWRQRAVTRTPADAAGDERVRRAAPAG